MCGDGGGGGDSGESVCEAPYQAPGSPVGGLPGNPLGSPNGDYFCGGPGGDPGDWP